MSALLLLYFCFYVSNLLVCVLMSLSRGNKGWSVICDCVINS